MVPPAAHSLMPLLTNPRRLKYAARACMRRSGAPGPDGVTWAQYRQGLEGRLKALSERLATDTWSPTAPRLVSWSAWGKQMHICVPTVEDRIVHRALRAAAESILESAAYPPWLFGWRPRKGRVEAVSAAADHIAGGYPWVADLDITRVTRGATVDTVLSQLAAHIHDGSFLARIRTALTVLPEPLYPGSGLTPMLTNVHLLTVDQQLNGLRVLRFTDNYAVFTATRVNAGYAMANICAALHTSGMEAHPEKSKVWRPNPEDLFLAG